jgi:hypothetical protein
MHSHALPRYEAKGATSATTGSLEFDVCKNKELQVYGFLDVTSYTEIPTFWKNMLPPVELMKSY